MQRTAKAHNKGLQRTAWDVGVLWPNGWMNLDATWYESTPRPMPHCVRRGPSSPERGTATPLFSAHVYCGHSCPSQPKRQRTAKAKRPCCLVGKNGSSVFWRSVLSVHGLYRPGEWIWVDSRLVFRLGAAEKCCLIKINNWTNVTSNNIS